MNKNRTDTMNSVELDAQHPFPGLRSFEEKNKSQFGGRDLEIRELFHLVEENGLTVIFGKSGIGKTSLVKAGLIPELQVNFYFPIYFRIDFSTSKPPLLQFKEFVLEEMQRQYSTVQPFGERTLWQFFHEEKLLDGMVTPVVILDQFEEMFTVGADNNKYIYEFLQELSDLIENRVPLQVQLKYQNSSEMMGMNYSDHPYRIVLSLREDYLAQLEGLKKYIPSIRNSRFRVLQMTAIQAMDAVRRPAKDLVDEAIAIEIVKKIPGVAERDFDSTAQEDEPTRRLVVEPFLLSLVCFQMNEKRIERKLQKITSDLVSSFLIEDVVFTYYNDVIRVMPESVRIGIEDTLLTESGFRKLQSLEELQKGYHINDDEIQNLIDKRIIRKERRDDVEYVELIHDVLAPIIKRVRDKRLDEQREKENEAAVQAAIEADRAIAKQRFRRFRNILIPTAIILIGFFLFVGYNARKNAELAKKADAVIFSQKLLVISNRALKVYGDDYHATLLSRAAYEIFKENGGTNDLPYYQAMYEGIQFSGPNKDYFRFSQPRNYSQAPAVRDMLVSNGSVYAAFADGKVYRKKWSSKSNLFSDSTDLLFDAKYKVTSIAANKNGSQVAIAGVNAESIILLNSANPAAKPRFLNIPFRGNMNGKSVGFNSSGGIVLQTDTAVVMWSAGSSRPSIWKARTVKQFVEGKQVHGNSAYQFGKSFLTVPKSRLTCFSQVNDATIIGTDSSIILLTPDSLIEMKGHYIKLVTSVCADENLRYIYFGTIEGAVARLNIATKRAEISSYQVGNIKRVICSADGQNIAAASFDGSIGLYKNEEVWDDVVPLVIWPPNKSYEKGQIVFNLTFSGDQQSVLAGYANGGIRIWPINAGKLAEIICETYRPDLVSSWTQYVDAELSKRYIGDKGTDKSLGQFDCKQ